VTFGAPVALVGLAAIPLLVAWYAGRQRGRASAAAAFVSAPLAASVAPRRPGWRRHLPPAFLLAAVAALILGLADPRTTHAQAVRNSAIMLACDVSGSMGARDVSPTRLRAVQLAALRFLAAVPARVSVGVMTFDQVPTVLAQPTTDRAADRRALRGWKPHGGTAIGSAIDTALSSLARYAGGRAGHPAASLLLLSDGGSTSGVDPITAARTAAARHIPIDTVALGTPTGTIVVHGASGRTSTVRVPPQPQALAAIARASGGRTYRVTDAAHLDAIYRRLGAKLGHRTVTHTYEAGLAGVALALLVLGGAVSLRLFGRLI